MYQFEPIRLIQKKILESIRIFFSVDVFFLLLSAWLSLTLHITVHKYSPFCWLEVHVI